MKRYRIGRAPTNEIVLQDRSVSREHADLTKLDGGSYQLRDLGSTYGTAVRLGADWHLVTLEEVNYRTPVRIGLFETTVAGLLGEVDPLAVYADGPDEPPWAVPEPRLSPDERAQQPETISPGWGRGREPAPLFRPPGRRTRARAATRPLVVIALIGLAALAIGGFLMAARTMG
jgi:hypothetical protein